MSSPNLPFCAACPMSERCAKAPDVMGTEPVQHVAGYLDELNAELTEYIDQSETKSKVLKKQISNGEEVYDPEENPYEVNLAFFGEAQDVSKRILDYLDLLPSDVSIDTLMALGQCAHLVANGDCFYTSTLPGFKDLLEENK